MALLWSPHTVYECDLLSMYSAFVNGHALYEQELIGIIALRPIKAALQWAARVSVAFFENYVRRARALPSRSFSSAQAFPRVELTRYRVSALLGVKVQPSLIRAE